MGTSHRQKPVKALVGEIRAGLRELFAVPDGYEVALGNGGATAFWDAAAFGLVRAPLRAPELRRVLPEVRARSTKGAPFLEEPRRDLRRSRRRARPGGPRGGRRRTARTLLAWAHNETSTGVMAPVVRPRRQRATRSSLIDATSGAGGLPVDVVAGRRLLLRAAEELRRRRRAVARAAQPRRAGADRRRCTPPSAGSPSSSRCTRRWRTRSRTRPTTRRRSRRCSCSPTRSAGCSTAAGWTGASRARSASSEHLYGWAERTAYTTPVRRRPGQALAGRRHDRLRRRVDAAAVAATLRANGIVDVEPYRKLGRNQLRIGMFPAVETADVQALTACIDWIVERTSRVDERHAPRRCSSRRRSATRASRCCASTSTSSSGSTGATSSWPSASATTTAS